MKKIVILVDQLHLHGGIEKLVATKSNYWADVFGYDVTILSTEQNNIPLVYELSKKVKFKDLKINYIRDKSYFSFINLTKFVKNVSKLQHYLWKNKPNFVLVASHIPVTYVVPFLFTKAKTIKEFHFTKFYENHSKLSTKIVDFIESKYNYLAVLSKEEQQFYPSKNTVVIPNPIKVDTEDNFIDNHTKQDIAIAVLRYAPVKNLEKMIEIWNQFHEKHKSWKLHIFGKTDGSYFKKIQQQVIENNLQETIIFKGETNNVRQELKEAKIMLITSHQECFPMVIIEANSSGVPVFSVDCPTGPRNIINHNTDGILIENNNTIEFVNALNDLATNDDLLNILSKNAIINSKKYNLDVIMYLWKEKIFEC